MTQSLDHIRFRAGFEALDESLRSDLTVTAPRDEPFTRAEVFPEEFQVVTTAEGTPALQYTWSLDFEGTGVQLPVEAGPCLEHFMRLDEGPAESLAERVRAFALRWGPLALCQHEVPSSHRLQCGRQLRGFESIHNWQRYITHLRALLSIAVELRAGRPASSEDWAAFEYTIPALREEERGLWTVRGPSPDERGDPDGERRVVQEAVNTWLRLGDVGFELLWLPTPSTAAPGLYVRQSGLVGRLAAQLATAISSERGLYRCAGCSQPFTLPEGRRRPALGRRAWCPTCGRAEQQRQYQRGRYQRMKAEQTTEEARDG